jgi:hypothetical protein
VKPGPVIYSDFIARSTVSTVYTSSCRKINHNNEILKTEKNIAMIKRSTDTSVNGISIPEIVNVTGQARTFLYFLGPGNSPG